MITSPVYRASAAVEFVRRLTDERHLQAAERCGRLGCWTYDPSTDVFVWSASLADMFGLVLKAPGTSLQVFVDRAHPKDREEVRSALRSAALGGQRVEWQGTVLRPVGAERHLHCCSETTPGVLTGLGTRLVGVGQAGTERQSCV